VLAWARARRNPRDPAPEGYVSTQRAADRLGASQSTASRMARLGQIGAVRDGKNWWIETAALDEHEREEARWITWVDAAERIGCNRHVIEQLVNDGTLTTRQVARAKPSILRASVDSYRPVWKEAQAERARRRRSKREEQRRRHALQQPPDPDHEWLAPAEAAEALGLSKSGIRLRVTRETLPATRVGKRWWIRRDHVDHALHAAAYHRDRAETVATT